MNMPAFTAEASLYTPRDPYHTSGHYQGGTARIIPTQIYQYCYTRKHCVPPVMVCYDVCFTPDNDVDYFRPYICDTCFIGIPGLDISLF